MFKKFKALNGAKIVFFRQKFKQLMKKCHSINLMSEKLKDFNQYIIDVFLLVGKFIIILKLLSPA